jgi:hypothetical protein
MAARMEPSRKHGTFDRRFPKTRKQVVVQAAKKLTTPIGLTRCASP